MAVHHRPRACGAQTCLSAHCEVRGCTASGMLGLGWPMTCLALLASSCFACSTSWECVGHVELPALEMTRTGGLGRLSMRWHGTWWQSTATQNSWDVGTPSDCVLSASAWQSGSQYTRGAVSVAALHPSMRCCFCGCLTPLVLIASAMGLIIGIRVATRASSEGSQRWAVWDSPMDCEGERGRGRC